MRVGLVEDDAAIRRVVRGALDFAGHACVAAHDGREAMTLLAGEPIDVLVLDIGLPDVDGRDLCQALRAAGQQAPVLFLTALGQLHDKAAAFAAGADDYLTKPFEVTELLLRLDALARRARPVAADTGLRLDPLRHALVCGAAEVRLTPTEFRLLGALAARPGEVVRRHEVVAAGWPPGAVVAQNTLDAYVTRLRRKLREVDAAVRLETVRGVGFALR